MSDKPAASFILVLIAAIIDFIIGIAMLAGASFAASIISHEMGMGWVASIVVFLAVWWLICGGLLFMSSMWIYGGEPGKVRKGGIIAIIFSILSINLLVIILGIVGGVLALTWKPPKMETPPQTGVERRPEETI